VPNRREIQDWLIAHIAELLNKDPGKIDIRESFSNYGLSSLDAVNISGEMEEFIGRRLSPTITYDYPNILTLSNYLSENTEQDRYSSRGNISNGHFNEPIAIIGMSCRFPGANDPDTFWQLVRDGVDMIKEVPVDRWPKQAFYHPDPSVPGKAISYWGGFLDNVDQFDPFFFGISPIEAKHMDPQQRLLLELSYEALDNAGQIKENIDGSDTGVFVGISINEYSQLQLNDPLQINSHSGTGSALSIAANRISYFFNFRGPSMAIDTACSSSLAAIHLACQSIRNGECEMAVAGGVNIILSPAHSIAFTKAGVLAPDGRCKTFDAEANGYVRGEGGGLIVLKRLSSAIADGDLIHATVLGSAMKQDGRTNGLIAPSSEGQVALLREAYKVAGVSPGSVQYIEAHGTGTLLGDSIEAKALGDVIGVDRKNGFCSIGSVKTNIGHLEAAAGVAGLIKVIQSIKHKTLPPSLHYHSPNPHIPFDQLNLKVNNELRPWSSDSGPRLAGISSFGFGGTNVHMIVGEAGSIDHDKENNEQFDSTISKTYLLPLSAKSPEALNSTVNDFIRLLTTDSLITENDLCYAAGLRRSQFDYRVAVIGNSKNELQETLMTFLQNEKAPNIFLNNKPTNGQQKLVFVFSGQGGQWHGMGRELLKTEPVFYKKIEKIDQQIQENFFWSLMDELKAERPESWIDKIDVVQPAIFAIQVALAELWKSWGIIPDAVTGHSMGEVAAAHIAGILSLEDAVHIICSRSKLLKKLSGKGAMIATELSAAHAEEIVKRYDNDTALGVINSPVSTVLSGDLETLNKIMVSLQQQNLFCKQVNVDVASHSPQIDLLRSEMLSVLKDIHPQSSIIPIYSTVTGKLVDDIFFDSEYWIDNLRKPVLFSDTVNQLLNDGYSIFVEIGPHPVLLSSIQQSLESHNRNISLLPSLRREEPEYEIMLKGLSALYMNGFAINWKNIYHNGRKYVQLPPIPWHHQRYWLDTKIRGSTDPWHRAQTGNKFSHPLLGERISLANSPSTSIWQAVPDNEILSFLNDHQINNEIVFPAAGYIEMALTALKEAGLNNSHELSDLTLKEKMTLQNGSERTIQTLIDPDKEDNLSFSIYSRTDADRSWILHASASIIKKENHDQSSSMINSYDDIREQSNSHFTIDEFYKKLQSRGIQYGKSFRVVEHVVNKNNRSSGLINLPGELQNDADSYQIHPVLLDGCLQIIAATQTALSEHGLYLPIGCKHIRFYSKPGRTLWSHISMQHDQSQSRDILNADIILSDNNGNVVAELIGFSLQRTTNLTRHQPAQQNTWMYQLQWQVKENSIASPVALQQEKHWLIFGDDNGLTEEITKQLELSGDHCHLLSYKDFEDDLAGKVEKVINEISFPLYGIIHLWNAAISKAIAETSKNTIAMSMHSCNSIIYLIQALSKCRGVMPRLWLVTKGAQPVINGEQISAEQSTLWGLGKTLSFEIPELKCIRIDLDPLQTDVENSHLLFKQVSKDDSEDQIAFRKDARYVQRLLSFTPNTSFNPVAISLRSDSTYLITGGMGGLGLKTAEWMVSRGAKHLLLLGRNKPSQSAMNVIDQLRDMDVEVVIAPADVSDSSQLKKVFDKIEQEMLPLRGVIHAAGILDDGSLLNLNAERMKKVMASKVSGTWNLHHATMDISLDFFVLFSSAVSVLGSPGQGNYAAACSYLDALAHLRHQMELPATSINWGPWAEVGLAAKATEKLNEHNASTQHLVKVIKIDRGLEMLEQLIMGPIPQVMVLPFDLKDLIELYPTAAAMPFFSEVGGNETHAARLYARPKLRQQYVAPRNEIERKLAELWRQTLHIDNVGMHDSFFELGGDSVLAAQILAQAQKIFGIRINPQDAFKAFTIEKLAEMLEVEIISKIEQMSDQEAEERLSKRN
jgi:myxalamid-type polyketide synthase MxaE and MxaD